MTKRERKKATGISLYPSEVSRLKELANLWDMSINDAAGHVIHLVYQDTPWDLVLPTRRRAGPYDDFREKE